MFPFGLKKQTNIDGSTIIVPCGKCPECRRRRIAGWTHRLLQEDKKAISAFFLTLTYDVDHVPITKNKFLTLKKHDLQCFIKRLRKMQKTKIIYFACGEYGGQKKRPHYHMILFNLEKDQYAVEAWTLDKKLIGELKFGTVTGSSIAYTLKYMDKPSVVPQFKNDDREKEFQVMSKGIGASYISEKSINWHNADKLNRMFVPISDYKVSMPRYYKEKLYHTTVRKAIGYAADKKGYDNQMKRLQAQLVSTDYQTIIHNQVEADKAKIRKFNNNASKDSF